MIQVTCRAAFFIARCDREITIRTAHEVRLRFFPMPDADPMFAPLVLASRSPRRATLLREAGFDFVQRSSSFDEPPLPAQATVEEVQAIAVQLAWSKARHVPCAPGTNRCILAADTIVVAPDCTLLGQPTDRADAWRMLDMLVGHVHHVVTAVALVDPRSARQAETFHDTARVNIGELPDGELRAYLNSEQWQGKAGGYNLAELTGRWPIAVEPDDDPTTVVGLPMRKLVPALARWGVEPVAGGRR